MMENPLRRIVELQKGVCLLDGGMGTELERMGKDLSKRRSLWSAGLLCDDPDAIRAVHRGYLEAGSNVITTCSYQASEEGFAREGFSTAQAHAFLQTSVRLAVDAKAEFLGTHPNSRPILVAASLGCYGAFLADGSEYTGRYADRVTTEMLMDFHRKRIEILVQAQDRFPLDLLAFETIPNQRELQAITRLLRTDGSCRVVPSWIAMACQNSQQLTSGESMAECAQWVRQELPCFHGGRLAAFGINCTPPQYAPQLVANLHEMFYARERAPTTTAATTTTTTRPLILCYPNRGEEWDALGGTWKPQTGISTPSEFAHILRQCHKNGAPILGGIPTHALSAQTHLNEGSKF